MCNCQNTTESDIRSCNLRGAGARVAMPPDNPSDKLESWKEIAAYIGRDVRTAMRWAQQGMPVHRVPGAKKGRIFAFGSEIDSWLNGQAPYNNTPAISEEPRAAEQPVLRDSDNQLDVVTPQGQAAAPVDGIRRASPALKLLVLAIAIVGLALVAWGIRSHASPKPVERFAFAGNRVSAVDSEGHILWEHSYPDNVEQQLPLLADLPELVRTADLFGDGGRESLVVVPFRLGYNPEDPFRVEVDCFNENGTLLWSYSPQASFRFGSHVIDGDWKIADVLISNESSQPRVWVSVYQGMWGNSFVVELEPHSGKPTLRFVNTGIIHKLSEIKVGDRRYLLAAGFNNEHDSGALAVIDEAKAFSVSPQTRGTRHYCDSCPAGLPDYYLVFPRSEINRVKKIYEDQVDQITVRGAEVRATKKELHERTGATMIYLMDFQGGLHPVSLRYDSTYDMLHRELEGKGEIDHGLEHCPERMHPQSVRLWTQNTGWTQLDFPAAKASD